MSRSRRATRAWGHRRRTSLSTRSVPTPCFLMAVDWHEGQRSGTGISEAAVMADEEVPGRGAGSGPRCTARTGRWCRRTGRKGTVAYPRRLRKSRACSFLARTSVTAAARGGVIILRPPPRCRCRRLISCISGQGLGGYPAGQSADSGNALAAPGKKCSPMGWPTPGAPRRPPVCPGRGPRPGPGRGGPPRACRPGRVLRPPR